MKKILILSMAILVFCSCKTQKPLYLWGNYDLVSFTHLKNSDEESKQALMAQYSDIIQKHENSKSLVPPGIYADYGFLLLQAGKTAEGKEMLLKEAATYPESAVYVDRALTAFAATPPAARPAGYKAADEEKPQVVLIMPPVNRSRHFEAGELFHSTLGIPIADAGYYVIPTFLSKQMLEKEIAYDAELFHDQPLDALHEVFGADLALFTIIYKWDAGVPAAKNNNTLRGPAAARNSWIEIEYILKSTRTNEVLFARTGSFNFDTPASMGLLTEIELASRCNDFTFGDLPAGKYSPGYGEKSFPAGDLAFMVRNPNSGYRMSYSQEHEEIIFRMENERTINKRTYEAPPR